MKRILSMVLALAVLLSLAVIGNTLPAVASTGVVYSGLPTEINAEGTQTIGDVTISRSVAAQSTLNYNSETKVLDVATDGAGQADLKVGYHADKNTGGMVYYMYEFKTGASCPTVYLRAGWEGSTEKNLLLSGIAANKSYNVIIGYNTQTTEISMNINGTVSTVPASSLMGSDSTQLTAENGINYFKLRFYTYGATSSATVTNISVIKDSGKTGYGTYFSGLGGVNGTAKVENGVSVYVHNAKTELHKVEKTENNSWKLTVGEDFAECSLRTDFAACKSMGGIIEYKYNFNVGSVVPSKVRTNLYSAADNSSLVQIDIPGVSKYSSNELVLSYNTKTGAAKYTLNGALVSNANLANGVYNVADADAGISAFKVNILYGSPSAEVTFTNVEVTKIKILGDEYGTMLSGINDISGSGNSYTKSTLDGATLTVSYPESKTTTSITIDNGNLVFADNDGVELAGEVTSKLSFPAATSFSKKGIVYYEFTTAFNGQPYMLYLDLYDSAGTRRAFNAVVNDTGKNTVKWGNMAFDGTEYTWGLAYDTTTGDWAYIVNGEVSVSEKMNTTVSGATVTEINGISYVQMRFFGSLSDNAATMTLKDASVKFIPYDSEQTIGDIVLDKENGTANVTIIKNAFNSTIDGSVMFMIASYDGARLAAIKFDEIKLLAGERTYTLNLGDKNGGSEVKAYLWSNQLRPIR